MVRNYPQPGSQSSGAGPTLIATSAGAPAHIHCNLTQNHCDGIAIVRGGTTLIATDRG